MFLHLDFFSRQNTICIYFRLKSVNFIIDHVSQVLADKDPGLTGNLLVERLVGAHIDLVSKEEYAKIGSVVCPLLTLVLIYFFVFVLVHYSAITNFSFYFSIFLFLFLLIYKAEHAFFHYYFILKAAFLVDYF